jgi:hypothetical protein
MIASTKPKSMKRRTWKPRHRPHQHTAEERKKIAAYLRFMELSKAK